MAKSIVDTFEEVEAEVLEASVVEDEELLAPRPVYAPATIDAKAYLEYTRGRIAALMEPYEGMDEAAIAQMDIKEVKLCRADLNRLINELEDQRKTIKKAYTEPLKAFEAEIKDIELPMKNAEAMLGRAVQESDLRRKELLRQGLEATYNDYAGELAGVVPFERFKELNPKWLNLSYGSAKAGEEIQAEVGRLAREWMTLKSMSGRMRFYKEAEAEFFRTLDLASAMDLEARRTEEQARIDAMKQAIEPEPEPIEQPEPEVEPTQEIAGEPGPAGRPHQGGAPGMARKPYVIRALMTDAEAEEVKAFMVANGIGEKRSIGLDG